MSSESLSFHESNLWSTPIRDLGLTIEGTRLEPILAEFEEELENAGTALHAERVGHVEGFDRADILRYLRHEMGHVINYAYVFTTKKSG